MTNTQAYQYFKNRIESGQCGQHTTQREAFEIAMNAIELIEHYEQSVKEAYRRGIKDGMEFSI